MCSWEKKVYIHISILINQCSDITLLIQKSPAPPFLQLLQKNHKVLPPLCPLHVLPRAQPGSRGSRDPETGQVTIPTTAQTLPG